MYKRQLVASGTATLELAAAGVPMVVGYRAAAPTVWAARRLLRVHHVALPNILLGRPLVPELLQRDCTPAALAEAASLLLGGGVEAVRQRTGFAEAMRRLGPSGKAPSRHAADIILSLARAGRPPQIARRAQ